MDSAFNPDNPSSKDANLFGIPSSYNFSKIIIQAIPWEVTVSYRSGTVSAHEHIKEASFQIDLFHSQTRDLWKNGYFIYTPFEEILKVNNELRPLAEAHIESLACQKDIDVRTLEKINEGCDKMVDSVEKSSMQILSERKIPAVLGGDHSTTLGLLKALAKRYQSFGILQLDAHADLRNSFEGFKHSHASVMYNALEQIPQIKKLVQVGVRDYGYEETNYIAKNDHRITPFFDSIIKDNLYKGGTWDSICEAIVQSLPELIHLSYDIDVLDPKLCPNTGTPVPGGYEADQINYLLWKIVESGRTIISFDLTEVACGDEGANSIDAIAGARVLYSLCNYCMKSNED